MGIFSFRFATCNRQKSAKHLQKWNQSFKTVFLLRLWLLKEMQRPLSTDEAFWCSSKESWQTKEASGVRNVEKYITHMKDRRKICSCGWHAMSIIKDDWEPCHLLLILVPSTRGRYWFNSKSNAKVREIERSDHITWLEISQRVYHK